MWPSRWAEAPVQRHGADQGLPINLDRISLRFCDAGIEAGFTKDRVHTLTSNFRMCCAVVAMLAIASLLMAQAWEQGRFSTVEENQTFELMTIIVSGCVVLAAGAIAVTFFSARVFGSNSFALEVFVVVWMMVMVVAHTFALPWYAARVLGFDPQVLGTTFGQLTDTRMVLAIDGFVTATHLTLPVRFYIIVIVDVASVLCYMVPTWALGGPEMEFAPLTLIFLTALILMAACGTRRSEYQERMQFLSLINERSLRFQSEFKLSQHVLQPGKRKSPSEEDSRPETTDTGRAFMLSDSNIEELVPLGEREQWLIRLEALGSDWSPIGEGGYGKVYSGLYLGHPVAIKVPKVRHYERTSSPVRSWLRCVSVRGKTKLPC
jgi:hypothetical protein